MHESALMAALIRQVAEIAQAEGARKVVGVTVSLGALAPVTPPHLRDHFQLAAAGTLAEGATLTIQVETDPGDPQAQTIRLIGVEVEEEPEGENHDNRNPTQSGEGRAADS